MVAPEPAGVNCEFVREIMLLLDGISVEEKAQLRERVHPCNAIGLLEYTCVHGT